MLPTGIERVVYIAYLLLGPAAWVLYLLTMQTGQVRMRLVRRSRRQLPESPPAVTILIPAKDEGERIRDCVLSALSQDYPNFHVVAIDDRSTDRTGAILDEIAAGHPKLTALHIPPGTLPEGWTGKCNALACGVRDLGEVGGQWLLFVDSDVILQPDALSATLAVAAGRKYDLLSLLPRLECRTFWEELVVPLAGSALSMLHLIALTNADNRKTAFANGQFILIRTSAYNAIGGHGSVRDQFCEDIEMARLVKRQGLRPRISWGADLAAVRMYSSLSSIMRGWARIFYAGSLGRPLRSLLGIAFLLLCGLSVYPALAWGAYRLIGLHAQSGAWWLGTAGLHWLIMTLVVGLFYSWSGNARRMALAFPLGAVMLIGIFGRALWMCLRGNVEWRGTRYGKSNRYSRHQSGTVSAGSAKTQPGGEPCPPAR
jgi:chlorobactene glucosyltransferase